MTRTHPKMSRVEVYNARGTVKKTEKSVVLEINTGTEILELHFGDADQIMNWLLLMIEEMAQVFPEHEASKLWQEGGYDEH